MLDYENKQIPQKTGLASYLVSKSHGSEVLNCRDKRVFFSLVTIAVSPLNFRRKQQEKTSGTQCNADSILKKKKNQTRQFWYSLFIEKQGL